MHTLTLVVMELVLYTKCTMHAYEGRTAMHRAIEVHGQPADTPGSDLKGIKDSTEIARLLVQHGAEINQPV